MVVDGTNGHLADRLPVGKGEVGSAGVVASGLIWDFPSSSCLCLILGMCIGEGARALRREFENI